MDNKTSAALGAALGVAVTVTLTKAIAKWRASRTSAEEEAALTEMLNEARAEGWWNGRDHLLEQLAKIGVGKFDPDRTEVS